MDVVRTCSVCNKAFRPRRTSTKYCSRTCQTNRFPLCRPCRTCGEPIERSISPCGNWFWRKYCSTTCRGKALTRQPTYPCAHCGASFRGRNRTRPRQKRYCSIVCSRASKVPVSVRTKCDGCGVPLSRSVGRLRPTAYCSRSCQQRHLAERTAPCPRCGKVFKIGTRPDGSHCSFDCRWPPRIMSCAVCRKRFRAHPYDKARQFCSFECSRKWVGETSIEKAVRLTLRSLGIRYEQEVQFKRYCADFVLRRDRIILEVDGVHWHSMKPERDRKRDAFFRRNGWRVVRVTDRSIKKLGAEPAVRVALSLPEQPLLFSEHQPRGATA